MHQCLAARVDITNCICKSVVFWCCSRRHFDTTNYSCVVLRMVVRLLCFPARVQFHHISLYSHIGLMQPRQPLRRSTRLALQGTENKTASQEEPSPSPRKRSRKRSGQENNAQPPLKRSPTRVTGAFGSFEVELWKQHARVVGVDEAGRGPLAGMHKGLAAPTTIVRQARWWQRHAASHQDGRCLAWLTARP